MSPAILQTRPQRRASAAVGIRIIMRAKVLITIAVLGGILLLALALALGPRCRPVTSKDR